MDEGDIPALKYHVTRIVQDANQPGGALSRREFTMKKARRAVAEALGLEMTCLDDAKWKQMVRDLVQEALDELPSASSPVSTPKQTPRAKAKPKARKTPSPSPKPSPNVNKASSRSKGARPVDVISISSSPEPEPKIQAKSNAEREDVIGIISESEMSSVYDEPPKRQGKKRKSNANEVLKVSDQSDDDSNSKRRKGKTETKKRRASKAGSDLSPDEARVAELKKLAFACGVRKQWTKELADCSSSKSQIAHLLRLLQSLGIKGTPTLSKAKALKEKRELAAEIKDVVAFEAERGVGADRLKRGAGRKTGKVPHSDDDDSDAPKVKSANQAVFDFCAQDGDESD